MTAALNSCTVGSVKALWFQNEATMGGVSFDCVTKGVSGRCVQ